MMKKKAWTCLIGGIVASLLMLIAIAAVVYKVDPFFHYHKPNIDMYLYTINNQRSQNDGIIKNFEYNAIVTGTSMTENTFTSEVDEFFGVNSIKVPYSGGTYKEINDSVRTAYASGHDVDVVIRCIDTDFFLTDKDNMRTELGDYPVYLYNDSCLDDYRYLLNRDVIGRTVDAIYCVDDAGVRHSGITSFDDYSNQFVIFGTEHRFGKNEVIPEGIDGALLENDGLQLSSEDKANIDANFDENVVGLAAEHPETQFYYFFPPYSVVWWYDKYSDGEISKHIEVEKYVIEKMLPYENLHLYSFNTVDGLTTDLNNYSDKRHYGEWINSFMIREMSQGNYQLTEDNYCDYLDEEERLYSTFDYSCLNTQSDSEDDWTVADKWR